MGFRLAVLGGSAAEIDEGLQWLAERGADVAVRTPPRESSPGRWMATVTPKAPADDGGLTVEGSSGAAGFGE